MIRSPHWVIWPANHWHWSPGTDSLHFRRQHRRWGEIQDAAAVGKAPPVWAQSTPRRRKKTTPVSGINEISR
jgi:hypothetical protein